MLPLRVVRSKLLLCTGIKRLILLEQPVSVKTHYRFVSHTLKPDSEKMTCYSTISRGKRNSESFRLFLQDASGPISPFHDIPLFANGDGSILNMVVEIPRWTNAKMEISKEEFLNPIKQDVKKGKLRYVANIFPNHGYLWNYGALPQTWEDPDYLEPETDTKGDKDPIDICEIGSKIHEMGSVIQVKVLGIMCLIDEGETDWKVIAVDVNDALADKLNDIEDLSVCCPGFIKATYDWFRLYKVPDGKPENKFAFGGQARNKEFALSVVNMSHEHWKTLVQKKGNIGGFSCANTRVTTSPHVISRAVASENLNKTTPVEGADASIAESVDKWHFVC